MACTFADIKKNAENTLSTFIDEDTPAGHFGAVTVIQGELTTYLLADARNIDESVIKGHIVITGELGEFSTMAYKGAGLISGYYMSHAYTYEEAFARMV